MVTGMNSQKPSDEKVLARCMQLIEVWKAEDVVLGCVQERIKEDRDGKLRKFNPMWRDLAIIERDQVDRILKSLEMVLSSRSRCSDESASSTLSAVRRFAYDLFWEASCKSSGDKVRAGDFPCFIAGIKALFILEIIENRIGQRIPYTEGRWLSTLIWSEREPDVFLENKYVFGGETGNDAI